MRRCAGLAGCWCGSLQLTMIYGLSFLWSATPQTALWVLMAWLSGSLLGVQRGNRRLPPWQWLVPAVLMIGGFHLKSLAWQIITLSSFLAGVTGGHWLATIEFRLIMGLRWETLGMGLGFLVVGGLAFQGLVAMECWCAVLAGLTYWREEPWRNQALQAFH